MIFQKKIKKNKAGFTIIEALIFSFLVVIVVMSFYRTMTSGSKVLSEARARTAASQVANETIEVLKNVSYEDLHTGYADSIYLNDNTVEVTRSGIKFNVNVEVIYVDDDFDGNAPADTKPNDYKQVEVTVSWQSSGQTKEVKMFAHIAPPGTEELYNGGILNIEIRQSDGKPVEGASYEVKNLSTNVTYTGTTGANGKIYLVGYAPGDKIYQIKVRNENYFPVDTFAPFGPTQNEFDPVDEHASVVLAGIWSQTIIFDKLSAIDLKTQDPLGNSIANIDFSLEGGRKVGDTIPFSLPVYTYKKHENHTDSSGEFTLANISPGKYVFDYSTISANNQNYKFWKVEPYYSNSNNAFFADPNIISNVKVVLLPMNTSSLFFTVKDPLGSGTADDTPISEATVTLKNSDGSYTKTVTTDQFGHAYFPINEDGTITPLSEGIYEIKVQATGYAEKNDTVDVSSNLVEKDIFLE